MFSKVFYAVLYSSISERLVYSLFVCFVSFHFILFRLPFLDVCDYAYINILWEKFKCISLFL